MGEWFIRMKAAAHKARCGDAYQDLIASELAARSSERQETRYRCHLRSGGDVTEGERLLVAYDGSHHSFRIAQDAHLVGDVDVGDSARLASALASDPGSGGMGVFLVVSPVGLDGTFECVLTGE